MEQGLFKKFPIFSSGGHFFFFLGGGGGGGGRAEIFDSFGRGSYEEHLGEIILNFGPTIQKMPFKDLKILFGSC